MGRVGALVLVLLLALPVVVAQTPPVPDPDEVRDQLAPVLDDAAQVVVPGAENATGEDLHTEDIRVGVLLDASNLEYQVFGILFGGGKVQADVHAEASLEFRAVSVERLDQAIQAFTGDENATLNGTLGVPVHRAALTAEEIRLAGSGMLLQAFQEFESEAARGYLQGMVPGLRVLGLEARWSNTAPASYLSPPDPNDPPQPDGVGVPPLREPPLVLEVDLDLQYLQRFALYELLSDAVAARNADPDAGLNETPEEKLRRQIEENQTLPLLERSAFEVIAYGQLLDFAVPHGWRLDVHFAVPKGFTVESVTDELAQESQQDALFSLDGRDRSEDASLAGVVTVSNRNLVTTTLFVSILLVGLVLRVLVELSSMGWYRLRYDRARRKGDDRVA